MTVSANLKKTLANIRWIESEIRMYREKVQHPEAKAVWERQIPRTSAIIRMLEERLKALEFEEPQYKGK